MIRLLALAAILSLTPAATASLARLKATDESRPRLSNTFPVLTRNAQPPAVAELTDDTEVFLDGRRCTFKDVPTTATVAQVVLAEDGKTVTRIEFQTKK